MQKRVILPLLLLFALMGGAVAQNTFTLPTHVQQLFAAGTVALPSLGSGELTRCGLAGVEVGHRAEGCAITPELSVQRTPTVQSMSISAMKPTAQMNALNHRTMLATLRSSLPSRKVEKADEPRPTRPFGELYRDASVSPEVSVAALGDLRTVRSSPKLLEVQPGSCGTGSVVTTFASVMSIKLEGSGDGYVRTYCNIDSQPATFVAQLQVTSGDARIACAGGCTVADDGVVPDDAILTSMVGVSDGKFDTIVRDLRHLSSIGMPTRAGMGLAETVANGIRYVGLPSPLSINGGLIYKRTAISDQDYSAQPTDYIIAYTLLTGPHSVTLPAADSIAAGTAYVIKDETGTAGSRPIKIIPAGGKLNGLATMDIATNFGSITVYSSGTAWFTK